jgi:glycosyltransferase involved in cell wall biosynthesis
MKYFISEIFPKVQQVRPDIKLFITGSLFGVDLSDFPKNEGVIFTGYLEDIRKAVAESWVCVVPIRLGGGTRLKILEALSLQTSVVATSKGAEGLDLISGQDYLVGDTPHEFSEQVIQLIQNEDIRNRISQTGFASVKAKYNWRRGDDQLEKFISRVTESNVNS